MESRLVTNDEQGMPRLSMGLVNANIFPLLSALWLADDSAAVSLRYVLTRDQMMSFGIFSVNSSVVHSAVFLVMVDTCALMDIRTSQAMDRSRSHHTLQLTLMSHRS